MRVQLAVVAADLAGLHIVDVSNPISPTLAGIYGGLHVVHGVAVAESSSDRAVAYLLGEGGEGNVLLVLDVSDLANPLEVGYFPLLTEAYAVAVAEDGSGQTYIYLANLEGGLAILRVRYQVFLPLVLRGTQ
jgi:hypothetical protein